MTCNPAARVEHMTEHGVPALPGPGSPDVEVGDKRAWRTMIDACNCPVTIPGPHGAERCYLGSTTVLINDKMACRKTDILQDTGPPNRFSEGDEMVIVGDDGIGMARSEAADRYGRAMRRIYENWDNMTPKERIRAMEKALNDSLPKEMPDLIIQPVDLEDATGQLDFDEWAVSVERDMFEGDMDEDRFARLSNTIYHEGRHGEQWYRSAQYRAGEGYSAENISADMDVPQYVAESAHDNPAYAGSSEAALGETVYNSAYGDRRDYRAGVLGDYSEQGYDNYYALPEEQDAFTQGDGAEESFWSY